MRPVQIIVAGAQKAGTSSLKEYISQHPGVCTHKQLEMMYFVNDHQFAKGYNHAAKYYFPCIKDNDPVILAKSVGIMYTPIAIERLCSHNPQIQIIISLRNPVDRAYSAYWYARRMGWEDISTFDEAIYASPDRFSIEDPRSRHWAYLDRSLYIKHLRNIYNKFSYEQIHIILLEDIKRDVVITCQALYSLFDELDTSFIPNVGERTNVAAIPRSRKLAEITSNPRTLSLFKRNMRRLLPKQVVDHFRSFIMGINEARYSPPPMNLATREELVKYFTSYNHELGDLIRRELSHWGR